MFHANKKSGSLSLMNLNKLYISSISSSKNTISYCNLSTPYFLAFSIPPTLVITNSLNSLNRSLFILSSNSCINGLSEFLNKNTLTVLIDSIIQDTAFIGHSPNSGKSPFI